MSFMPPPPKTALLIVGFTLIGLTMLACGSQASTSHKVMLTRLPTLTPTVMGNAAAPMNGAAPQPAPAPANGAEQPAPATAVPVDNAAAQPAPATPAPVDNAATATTAPVADAAQPAAGAAPSVVIATLNKVEEYVDLQNVSNQPQDLRGWNVLSEKDGEKCNLAGTLAPGETLRIWALATQAAQGGYNCGFSQEIWRDNEADEAILSDALGNEMSRAK